MTTTGSPVTTRALPDRYDTNFCLKCRGLDTRPEAKCNCPKDELKRRSNDASVAEKTAGK